MKKTKLFLFLFILIGLLAACGDNDNANNNNNDLDGLKELKVDFELPETANVGDTVELKATVTYGDELVPDAQEVNFEYWQDDDKDNSITVDSTNNEDGTYTATITLEEDDVVYSIYAHTTAHSAHTMPLKHIIVGDAELPENSDENEDHEHHNNHH